MRTDRTGRWTRLVTAIAALALLFSGPGGPEAVRSQAAPDGLAEVRASVDRFSTTMYDLAVNVDPASYDVDELAMLLAFEDADSYVLPVAADA